MALNLQHLSVLAFANGFTLWHYKSVDDDPRKDGFFNNAHDMMQKNDIIFALSDFYKGVLIVHENKNGNVVVKEFF